jgi:hypothetical protein
MTRLPHAGTPGVTHHLAGNGGLGKGLRNSVALALEKLAITARVRRAVDQARLGPAIVLLTRLKRSRPYLVPQQGTFGLGSALPVHCDILSAVVLEAFGTRHLADAGSDLLIRVAELPGKPQGSRKDREDNEEDHWNKLIQISHHL